MYWFIQSGQRAIAAPKLRGAFAQPERRVIVQERDDYMRRGPKIRASPYTVQWNYLANDGRKAERYGPYMLQASIVRSFVNPHSLAQRDIVPLGVISVELMNEVSHRHAFWVITEAALDSLELKTETREQISAELSIVVPLPSESEFSNHKNRFNTLSRTLRRT